MAMWPGHAIGSCMQPQRLMLTVCTGSLAACQEAGLPFAVAAAECHLCCAAGVGPANCWCCLAAGSPAAPSAAPQRQAYAYVQGEGTDGSSGINISLNTLPAFYAGHLVRCAALQAVGAAGEQQHVTYHPPCYQCMPSGTLCCTPSSLCCCGGRLAAGQGIEVCPRCSVWDLEVTSGTSRSLITLPAIYAGYLVHCALLQAAGPAGEQPRPAV